MVFASHGVDNSVAHYLEPSCDENDQNYIEPSRTPELSHDTDNPLVNKQLSFSYFIYMKYNS